MGAPKQTVLPPQRGIFPLDHDRECRQPMDAYLDCLKVNRDMHHKCRDFSKEYLQCRMDRDLMSKENLENLGYREDATVQGAKEYNNQKEKAGFVAGTHIDKERKSFWSSGK